MHERNEQKLASFWGPSRQAAFRHEQTGPRVVAAVLDSVSDNTNRRWSLRGAGFLGAKELRAIAAMTRGLCHSPQCGDVDGRRQAGRAGVTPRIARSALSVDEVLTHGQKPFLSYRLA